LTTTERLRYDPVAMTLKIEDYGPATYVQTVDVAGRSFTVWPYLRFSAKNHPGVPYDAELTVKLQDRGYVCTKLTVEQRTGGRPVTLAGIRSIPVESLVRQSLQKLLQEHPILESTAPAKPRLRFGGPLGLPVPTGRRTSKRRSPEQETADVELAAVVYRLAEVCGYPPTKAVADQLRIPLGTARFLVARAVKWDLLPARERGAK
jgi:hypothetical protein